LLDSKEAAMVKKSKKDMIIVKISRVISAPKWKILRLLTKVEEFHEYMPSVKEAVIIKKRKRRFWTRWHIQVDNVPIHWVEEDVFKFPRPEISFKAVEGDLQEFSGNWRLHDHPEGTLVEVTVKMVVGIPAIKHFAEQYIKGIIEKNFTGMLESIESRLISLRYAGLKKGDKQKVAGFGVLGHFYNYNHMMRSMKQLNKHFKPPSREFIHKLLEVTPSFKIYDMQTFKSKAGVTTNGRFILCTFIPDMVNFNTQAVYSKVVRACKVAEKYGVGIVTLGGFSSVAGERYGHQIAKEVDIPITTGNTYTAVLAVDGIAQAAKDLSVKLKDAKVAIIGGTGDIGSACARALAEKVRWVTITGRTKSNLRRLRGELRRRHKAVIEATTDNKKAVIDADIIIACASVSSSILDINWFKPGAIICDVAYPKNVSYMDTSRKDILVFSGGLSSAPAKIETGMDMGLPSQKVTYGCFSEVIILALERRYENFSSGRGAITLDKMNEIRRLGTKHGFGVAPFYWGDKLITKARLEHIKKDARIAKQKANKAKK